MRSLECSARSPKDPPDELRRHPHPRRPTAQPQEPRPRHPHRRDDGRDRAERLGQVEPGVRHAVRRRPAPLRRDLQRLRAPVPRPHGPAGGRPGRRRAAGDRDRPDQPGAQLALDGRHDDRAERPPEAAVRARRAAVRQADRAAGAPRLAGDDLRRADGAHRPVDGATIRAWSSPSRSSCRPTPAPRRSSSGSPRAASRACRPSARSRRRPGRASCSTWWPTASASRATEKVRAVEAIEIALKRGSGRVNVYVVAATAKASRRADDLWRFSTGLHCPESDLPLRRPAAGAVLVQLGLRRVRDLPRLRPRDRRRLRPGDPRPPQDAAHRRDQDRCRRRPGRSARTT